MKLYRDIFYFFMFFFVSQKNKVQAEQWKEMVNAAQEILIKNTSLLITWNDIQVFKMDTKPTGHSAASNISITYLQTCLWKTLGLYNCIQCKKCHCTSWLAEWELSSAKIQVWKQGPLSLVARHGQPHLLKPDPSWKQPILTGGAEPLLVLTPLAGNPGQDTLVLT